MNEHDNVRDGLSELIELAEATEMTTNGHNSERVTRVVCGRIMQLGRFTWYEWCVSIDE